MSEEYLKYILIGVGVLALFVKVPKIEVPVWKWILRGMGEAINAPLTAKIADLSKQISEVDKLLNEHIKSQDEAEITACRRRILRFDDEVRRKEKHSQEHWDNVIEDVDSYTTYCRNHPEYSNTKAEKAMEHLTETFKKLNPQDFL